jgi:mannan endo-1,4-beta-mannosidase
MRLLILFILLLSCGFPALQAQFVRVRGTQLQVNGKPYYYIGANYWYGALLGAMGNAGRQRLRTELDFLQKNGVTNLRVLAAAEGDSSYAYRVYPSLQPRPAQYQPFWLDGLDYLLQEMGRRNMKAVLYLTNTWEWSGGMGQYLEWNDYGAAPLPKTAAYNWDDYKKYIAQFYDCKSCIGAYEDVLRKIVGRTNRLTGKRYTDDAAIMSWEICNQPRPMLPGSEDAFYRWIQNTAALIKTIDPNHLVTTGSEGEVGCNRSMSLFEKVHADKNIDYLTIHIWPKNWQWFRDTAIAAGMQNLTDSTVQYILKHGLAAIRSDKPLVIEEFGLPRNGHSFSPNASVSLRNRYFEIIFSIWKKNRDEQGWLAGCNFWGFGGVARPKHLFWRPGDDFTADPPQEEQGLNTVFAGDASTWQLIRAYLRQ